MSVVQAVNVNGKPHIIVKPELNAAPSAPKFGYKTRKQRFLLRDALQVDSATQGNKTAIEDKPSKRGTTQKAPQESDVVTLTTKQLANILNSIDRSDRQRRRRSLDSEDEYQRKKRNSRWKRRSGSPDSAFEETAASEDYSETPRSLDLPKKYLSREVGPSQEHNHLQSKTKVKNSKAENIFRHLDKFETKGKKTTSSERKQNEESFKERHKEDSHKTDDVSGKLSSVDEVMRRIVLENKDKLTEEQLIALLARVYAELTMKDKKSHGRSQRVHIRRNEVDEDDSKSNVKDTAEDTEPASEYNTPRRPKTKQRHHTHRNQRADSNESQRDESIEDRGDASPRSNAFPLEKMSVLEKKQMQWKRERKELERIQEYNPWGKPGSGAPPETSPVGWDTAKRPGVLAEANRMERIRAEEETLAKVRRGDHKAVAIRLITADETERRQQEENARRKWLSELDAQVRQRQEMERNYREADTIKRHKGDDSPRAQERNQAPTPVTANSQPQFARGKGWANLEERYQQESESHRKKMLEHQETLRQQMEESLRRKEQEREKRLQEELEEERRLERQREQMHQHSKDPNRKALHQRNVDYVREHLNSAEMNARRQHQKHLEQSGHDTNQLHLNLGLDSSRSPSPRQKRSLNQNDNPLSYRSNKEGRNDKKLQTSRDEAVQTEGNSVHVKYSQKPTNYREEVPSWGNRTYSRNNRYFDERDENYLENDTQTAIQKYKHGTNIKPRTKIPKSMNQSIHPRQEGTRKKSHRHTENPSLDKRTLMPTIPADEYQHFARNETARKTIPINARPDWNAVNPDGRRVIKQSERDPFYWQRDHLRKERQQQLMEEASRNAPHFSQTTSMSPSKRPYPDAQSGRQRKSRLDDGKSNLHAFTSKYVASYPMRNIMEDPTAPYVRTTDILKATKQDYPIERRYESENRIWMRETPVHNERMGQFSNDNGPSYHYRDQKQAFYRNGVEQDVSNRQENIIRQLSDLRKGLLQKQKEVETSMSMTDHLS